MPLYVVATPIGNLGDITARALETLRDADLIACEDTRRTRAMLTHFGISRPLSSLPAFAERDRAEPLLARLRAGAKVALCTDAGTPGISDPGTELVRQAALENIPVIPIPGPSAVAAALSVAGLSSDRFLFLGFLPRKGTARIELVERAAACGFAVVIYESPERVARTLVDLRDVFGDRPALVARELTKLHEEIARGTLSTLSAKFADGARGEVVIVVEGGTPALAEVADETSIEDALRERIGAGHSPRDAARALAEERGLPRRAVYQIAMRLPPL